MSSSTDPPQARPHNPTKRRNGRPKRESSQSQSASDQPLQLIVFKRCRSDKDSSHQRKQLDHAVDGPPNSSDKSHPPKLVLDTKIDVPQTSETFTHTPRRSDIELRHQATQRGRRRKMRTVSQDDYLLARGANPRTGVVTPSVHSGSNSLEDAEWLRITGYAAPAKWRLQGDQWVSLGLDEPSPLPSPPFQRDDLRGRKLRMPPRLTGPRQAPPHQIPRCRDQRVRHRAQDLPKHNSLGFNGQQRRVAPSGPRDLKSDSYEDVVVRRKLLPPTFSVVGNKMNRRDDEAEVSTETVITKKMDPSKMRSSSMPTPEKISPLPAVTKALPALPTPELKVVKPSLPQPNSFLGLRPGDWIEDIPTRINGILAGFAPEPPCPPTNDIQSRSRPSQVPRLYGMQTQNHGQHLRNHASYISQRPVRSIKTGASPGQFPQPRPNHRMSPTVSHTMPLTGRGVNRPPWRSQNMPSPVISEEGQGMSQPSTITPITIPTTTNMPPGDRLVSSSWREIPSPMPAPRSKLVRPGMPGRTDGTSSVPQVSPLREEFPLPSWRATGISDSEISTITSSLKMSPEAERERDRIPGPLRLTNANTSRMGGLALGGVAVRGAGTDLSPLTCSQPQGRGLTVKPLNMPGSTLMPDGGRRENHDPFTDLSSPSGFFADAPGPESASEQVVGNHSNCCPECCETGCHGSCLGHPSPPVTPTATISHRLRAMGQGFRNSIRLSRRIRTRKSAGGSQEIETEETAELETPLAWEQGGPVSLGFPICSGNPNHWTYQGGAVQPGRRIVSNGSARSVRTGDLPPLQGVGGLLEALLVPLGALRMWLRKHPHLLALVSLGAVRLLQMSVHVLNTVGKIYSVAYVYSKTGKISTGRGQGLGGFTSDCVRAVVYALILAAITTVVGRVVAVLAGLGMWLVWSMGVVAWVIKGVGMGVLW